MKQKLKFLFPAESLLTAGATSVANSSMERQLDILCAYRHGNTPGAGDFWLLD